jgi:flagellar protein FlbD
LALSLQSLIKNGTSPGKFSFPGNKVRLERRYCFLIELSRLNKKKFILNCELIESIESTPDTMITLRNGKLLIVEETPERIAQMVLEYQRSKYSGLLAGLLASGHTGASAPTAEEDREA